jgi:thioredoxin 1
MEKITSIEHFRDIVNDHEYVFMDVYAEWCGPCKKITPMIEELIEDHPNVKFIKLDMDKFPKLAKDLGVKYLPTFILFDEGHDIGSVQKADIEKVKTMLEGY